VTWTRRRAEIKDDEGRPVFSREGVEAPSHWSDHAVEVVASRYLANGETSIRELVDRVAGELSRWVGEDGTGGPAYREVRAYREILERLLLAQHGAFNSPVWFNVGREREPQCSACFILSVADDLPSILELARTEGLIFQRGSGCGTNLSSLRSSREPIDGGGRASGPVSFMRGYDAFAGVIKSGGRTRRAAKMQILDAAHPDVLEFARCKGREEKKARALVAAGFASGLDGEAYGSVAFQNSNLSVRVPDAFFEAVDGDASWTTRAVRTGDPVDAFPARELLDAMAESAWACGDPGIQYAGPIDAWHTCPNAGPIRASNPCGEYLFLDDTACNLASLNLLKFLDADGTFAVEAFRRDIGTLLPAMEAVVGRASYPTPAIAEKSRRYRPLGLGYANLGALLMTLGLPYDSGEGRAWAAAVTALLTGEAYRVSTRLAEALGPCEGFQENRAPFLAVLERHRAALEGAALEGAALEGAALGGGTLGGIEGGPADVVCAAREAWDDVVRRAPRHGVRNSQATVIAPTGTIAFFMDCDTTGIEPDLSLVKYKRLAGGGTLRLVNAAVPRALRRLGYGDAAVEAIVAHVDREETIEGAPGLRDEHLAVFDCAFRAHGGTRCIAPEGHLAMMAAAQPFVSGGISKTVNLPEDTPAAEIARLFRRGHALGLKSLAVYRENSKSAQPLGTHCVVEPGGGCCD